MTRQQIEYLLDLLEVKTDDVGDGITYSKEFASLSEELNFIKELREQLEAMR